MTRPNGVSRGPLAPADWPAWVLSFGKGGYFPDDPVRQAARMVERRQWQQARDDWFADNGIPYSWMAVYDERQRRAAAWWANHPEDRGPTFRP